jgi:catechol 2,3-dioxygenase-like lactoylglutathione lyase family enzyme
MSMPVRIQSLHHVALPVSDLARAAKFYREVLGLEELERPHFSFAGKCTGWREISSFTSSSTRTARFATASRSIHGISTVRSG